MTRLSRFSAPRATIVAFVLLAVAIFGFQMLAEAGHGGELVATQEASSERPPLRDLPKFCWNAGGATASTRQRTAGGIHEQA